MPQARVVFRVAAAVIHLRVAALPGEHRRPRWPRGRAAPRGRRPTRRDQRHARARVVRARVAELAAHRGEVDRARELWALGDRLGANLVMFFQLGLGGSTAEPSATTTPASRCSPRGAAVARPQAAARVRELTADAG